MKNNVIVSVSVRRIMHFTTWMEEGRRAEYRFGTLPLKLKNGICLSIQANKFMRCIPRDNLPFSQYEAFEIGFPNMVIPEIMLYIDEPGDPTGTVYNNVPLEVIDQLMGRSGGVVAYAEVHEIGPKGELR